MSLDVRERYQRTLAQRGFIADPAQERAVGRLQQLFDEWRDYVARRRTVVHRWFFRPELPRGVYLWGGVGRGKSFLMDSFYASAPLKRKRRVHFHHFMREVHRELNELKGRPNPLDVLARRLARRYRLVCFDELHVNDIADAMLLGRLLERTMDFGVVYCMTSNYAPDQLYKDGLKRDDFLPTIDLLKRRLDVVHVDSGVDYRRRIMEQLPTYHTPLGDNAEAMLHRAFLDIAEVAEVFTPLIIEGRQITYRRLAGGVVWFDFDILCGQGRSQLDYLEIAQEFHTVILSNVPRMGSARLDQARRFVSFIDVLYDHRVKVFISAETAPDRLLDKEDLANNGAARAVCTEFDRTVSRLIEMQSREYLAVSNVE